MSRNKLLSNETFIRVISLLFAIIMWMYVVSIDNPQVDTTIRNVPIQVVNVSNIENNGLEIISMSDEKIDVKVTGRMSDVSNITSEAVTVQLDVSNIYSANNYYIKPEVKIGMNGISVADLSVDSVNIYVDYISRVEKELLIETKGQPEDGYSVSEVYSKQDKVIISGPQGIINRVDKVKAVVDITGASAELSKVCQVKLYSSNGEEIVSDKVKLTVTDVSVSVKFRFSRMMPVIAEIKDADTFNTDDYNVTVSVPEIEVFGEESFLKGVSHLKAIVENIPFDNEELLVSSEWRATLEIPDGITVSDGVPEITVKFEKK